MRIVLDANVALDWHLRTTKGDAYSLPLWKLGAAGNVRYIVPEHFNTEVARIVVIRGLKGGRDVAPMGPSGCTWSCKLSTWSPSTPLLWA